ncbi:alpha/beta hydrolase [Pseudothermotoga sp. U03pept]|uniref:alpha/beta hydrolase n=1 Tax=Pseudothermotoga sp. U03pept TaxID=3447012 RepID=UPI003F04F61C
MWIKEFKGEKPFLILVHGLGEHSKRYSWLCELLQREGYGLVLFDLPGHGESPGKRGHTSFKEVFEVLDKLTESHPNSFLMGHSLGGLIAIRYAETRDRIRGLIVTSPALRISKDNLLLRSVAAIFSLIFPRFSFDNGINPEHLSPNAEAVKKYVQDPLVHRKISARLAHDMLHNSSAALKDAKKINLPCFVAVGEMDKITLPNGAEEFFNSLASSDKIMKVYKGGYHELFEDQQNSKVFMNDLLNWLNSH